MKILKYSEFSNSPEAALNFYDVMNECKAQRAAKLLVEPGVYELDPKFCAQRDLCISNHGHNGPKRIGVLLEGMENFEIDFQGSTLVGLGILTHIALLGCKNVTIRNVKLKNPTIPILECRVIGFGEGFVDAEAVSGLENFELAYGKLRWEHGKLIYTPAFGNVEFDENTGEIARGTDDRTLGENFENLTVQKLGNTRLRISGIRRTPPLGNILAIYASQRMGAGIFCQHCENLRFENVDVCSCYGMGLLAQVCRNLTLEDFCTLREDGRCVTAMADATHFVNCTGLVKVENSTFVGQLDDALNIHGMYSRILAVEENTLLVQQVHHEATGIPLYEPGNRIRVLPPDTLLPYAEKTIRSVEKINDQCFRIGLAESAADIRVGDDIENLTLNCDLIFRNNVVRDNRARGMLIGTPGKVLIEQNTFHSSGTAVKFESDGDYWFESGGTTDVTIRENRFEDCKYGGWGYAVIEFKPRRAVEPNRYFHGTVRVEDNTFTGGLPELVSISNAEHFTFTGNRLELEDAYLCTEHIGEAEIQENINKKDC